MSEEKNVIHIHGNSSGSIIGNNLVNPTIHTNSNSVTGKTKEAWIEEILKDYPSYFVQIDKLDVSKEEKKEAKNAIYLIQEELHEEKPDVEKIQAYASKLNTSSQLSSICGAIFSLLQLFQ